MMKKSVLMLAMLWFLLSACGSTETSTPVLIFNTAASPALSPSPFASLTSSPAPAGGPAHTTPAPPPTATPAPASTPAYLLWSEAAPHAGEERKVCGPVIGAVYAEYSSGQPTFLNLGENYPHPNRFTVVIWGEKRNLFEHPPEVYYAGLEICITGIIELYEGIPEIIVNSPDQVELP